MITHSTATVVIAAAASKGHPVKVPDWANGSTTALAIVYASRALIRVFIAGVIWRSIATLSVM